MKHLKTGRIGVVREAALVAIAGLHFPHAFNPLARIYRQASDPRVRVVALQSTGKIQTVEAPRSS